MVWWWLGVALIDCFNSVVILYDVISFGVGCFLYVLVIGTWYILAVLLW